MALGIAILAVGTCAAQAPERQQEPIAPIRCDDWKKVGDHTWMVEKEVMLGTAPRQGEVLHGTPETDALDKKCGH